MTILAYLFHWRSLQVGLRGIRGWMRRVAVYTVRGIRVSALPARQENVKMIVKVRARKNIGVTLRARAIIQFVLRNRRAVIVPAIVGCQILGALPKANRPPKRSGTAVTINAARALLRVKCRERRGRLFRRLLIILTLGLRMARRAKGIVVFQVERVGCSAGYGNQSQRPRHQSNIDNPLPSLPFPISGQPF